MPNVLIADSGSTKTEWNLIKGSKIAKKMVTTGISPYFVDEVSGRVILEAELNLGKDKDLIDEVHFYGTGVKAPESKKLIESILKAHFPTKKINVYTDILGAARATCGNEKGVTAILGTGSNSCYYDGKKISKQKASMGYILGDEGSGTHLGKKVLQHFYYDTFDGDLRDAFIHKYGDDLTVVLDRVYRHPLPNRYVASYAEFLKDHRGHFMVENILEDSFLEFFNANILKYRESWVYPINFIGSIAHTFKDVLKNTADHYGLALGTISKSPMEGLVQFHK